MLELIDLEWKRIPAILSEKALYAEPFSLDTVLLCMDRKVFESQWIGSDHLDFDRNYAKQLRVPGYWSDPVGGRHLAHKPSHWASSVNLGLKIRDTTRILNQSSTREIDAAKFRLDLFNRLRNLGEKDNWTTLIQAPEWVEAKYEPSRNEWTDIFGRVTAKDKVVARVTAELPHYKLQEDAKLSGPAQPLWS